VKSSADEVADVPPGVVTVTFTVPALSAGLVAVICVAGLTVTLPLLVAPKATVAPEMNLVPVMVIDVPPAVDPVFGLTPETVGTAT
jgi:hypothetical protein